jgi:hypothetical protein
MGKLIGHGTLLERIQKFLPKSVSVIVKHRMKEAKLQWLQDPSVVNEDNLSNVRREASTHFRSKKMEYLKDKIN